MRSEGVTSETILSVQNAFNVLRSNPNANPLLGADCRSFEYAQPPSALQKGCAVTNFNHTFYTAGIRSNGSPYYGEIDVPVNLIYFTMPSMITNGQAANLTAAAVDAAIKATDLYYYRNPDATAFQVADYFRDELRVALASVGGSFSLTNEPFSIPSPAPYLTTIFGLGNGYDCD